jgi:hypothetical protein
MLLSATKSRKKQQAEAVQSVIQAEAEKRRKERENFHITSVPILVRAAHEPSLYNGASEEQHEEGNQDGLRAHVGLNLKQKSPKNFKKWPKKILKFIKNSSKIHQKSF